MDFASIDFETATSARDSACALGVCVVQNGAVAETRHWLIRPPGNEYLPFNTQLHGIGPADTQRAPEFLDVMNEALSITGSLPLVAHNASFDMSVLRSGLDRAGCAYPDARYYCTLVMSRAHWPELPSYSLPIVLAKCGATHQHHHAAEDAAAAAAVLLRIAEDVRGTSCRDTARALHVAPGKLGSWGYEPCGCPGLARKPVERTRLRDMEVNIDADSSNPFYDADVAFTGTLLSMSRGAAMECVAERGGRPRTSVSRNTEYLVVGTVEYKSLLTGEPSQKMKAALSLRADGCPLVILSEQEFLESF